MSDSHSAEFWNALSETPTALERDRIEHGEPWTIAAVAGLQCHAYHKDDGLDGRVEPRAGDRLHLVRQPDNRFDPNAVEVTWRNEHQLGHLSRALAAEVAPAMDLGVPLRAYVVNEGNGHAWSCHALLVGAAVLDSAGKWTARVMENYLEESWGRVVHHPGTDGHNHRVGYRTAEDRLEIPEATPDRFIWLRGPKGGPAWSERVRPPPADQMHGAAVFRHTFAKARERREADLRAVFETLGEDQLAALDRR